MKLPVVEMFVTIQGEGSRMGVPSLFIRLGGCSLACPGFGYEVVKNGKKYVGCDSIHAVNQDFSDGWDFYDNHLAILEKILELDTLFEDVVITGGEPMIHYQNLIFINLINVLIKKHSIHVETNGTIPIDFNKYPLYKDLNLTISPKMKISGESESRRIRLNVLRSYISNAKTSVLKIVMGKMDILNPREIQNLLFQLKENIPVYVMPLGATQEELNYLSASVWNFAKQNGYRFSDRLHIRSFNDKSRI